MRPSTHFSAHCRIVALVLILSASLTSTSAAQNITDRNRDREIIRSATSIAYSMGATALKQWLLKTGRSLPGYSPAVFGDFGDRGEAGEVAMFLFHNATGDSNYVIQPSPYRRYKIRMRLIHEGMDTNTVMIDSLCYIVGEGEQTLIDAHASVAQGQHGRAAMQFGFAVQCFRDTQFPLFEADARMRCGEQFMLDRDVDSALIELRRAQTLFVRFRYTRGEARCALLMAEARLRQGAASEAMALAQQARTLYEKIDDPAGAALSCLLLASLEERSGDLTRARTTRTEGLQQLSMIEAGTSFAAAQLLQAGLDAQMGNYTGALSTYEAIRTHAVPGLTPSMLTQAAVQTASLAAKLHYYDLARTAIDDATGKIERYGMMEHEGDLLLHRADFEYVRGSLDSAQTLCLQARRVFERRSDQHGQARTLLLEVRIHAFTSRTEDARHVLARMKTMTIRDPRITAEARSEEAILLENTQTTNAPVIKELQEAATVARSSGDLSLQGRILIALGDQYRLVDDRKAAECYEHADSLLERIGDVFGQCGAMIKRADVAVFYRTASDSMRARALLQRALRSMEHLDVPEVRAYALLELSNLERTLKDKTEQADAALKLLEEARRRMALPRNKEAYFGKIARYYERIFRFFYDIGHGGDFYVAQLMKARSFLDQISDTERLPLDKVPVELRRERDRIAAEIEAANVRLIRKRATSAEMESIRQDLSRLRMDEDDVRRRILALNPHLGGQTGVEPVGIDVLKRSTLRAGEALLEYLVVGKDAWLFVFRKDMHSGPIRIGSSQGHATGPVGNVLRIISMNTDQKGEQRCSESQSEELHRQLIEPARRWLAGATHLIIAPDQSLAAFPFEAIVTGQRPDGSLRYLVEDFTISYVQSATALALLRTRAVNSTAPLPSFVGFGAPVDPMTFAQRQGTTLQRSGGTRMATPDLFADNLFAAGVRQTRDILRHLGDEPLTELNATRVEVQAISAQFAREGRMARVLLDGEATEHAAKQILSSPTSHIHFACHGYYYQGVQCLFLTPDPEHGEDGFLGVDEIMTMDLTRVQLVVLSACQSAQGKLQGREGLTGFLRAFLIAGVRGVIGTTWSVDDSATAAFMEHFYLAMLDGGMEPRDALRAVKVHMMRHPQYRAPCYWAPFILYGN